MPEQIKSFINIEVLDLEFNNIDELPTWIVELKKLKTIKFANNKLNKLPDFLFDLKPLRYADFSENRIETIDIHSLKVNSLKELDLSFNHLNKVPDCLSYLRDLQILRLENNDLKVIPEIVSKMKSLRNRVALARERWLEDNPDQAFPSGHFHVAKIQDKGDDLGSLYAGTKVLNHTIYVELTSLLNTVTAQITAGVNGFHTPNDLFQNDEI